MNNPQDTNAISATPRTDARAVGHIGYYSCATVPAPFAQKLEIELNETKAQRDELLAALKMTNTRIVGYDRDGNMTDGIAFDDEDREQICAAIANAERRRNHE